MLLIYLTSAQLSAHSAQPSTVRRITSHHITSATDQPIINPDINRNKMAAASDARHVLAECQPRGRRHRVPRPPKDNASGIRRSGFLRLVNRAICNDYARAFYQPRLRHNVAIDSLPAPMIVDG